MPQTGTTARDKPSQGPFPSLLQRRHAVARTPTVTHVSSLRANCASVAATHARTLQTVRYIAAQAQALSGL